MATNERPPNDVTTTVMETESSTVEYEASGESYIDSEERDSERGDSEDDLEDSEGGMVTGNSTL